MNKEDVTYIQWNTTQSQNEILLFAATWVDMEGIMLSEISQTEKDKYCMISLTHTCNLKRLGMGGGQNEWMSKGGQKV